MSVSSVASGPAGIAAVQARVAEIRHRIADVGGTFALPPSHLATTATTATATTAPATATATTTTGASVAPETAVAPAGLTPPAPATDTGAGAPAAPATPAPAGSLAAKLPAAGQPWAADIERAATANGLDPVLLAAVVNHESNFNPNARSHAGAIGLGQLMPGTAAGLGVDPHDPQQNLDGAARYLKEQLDRFGRVDLALAAYNAGPNRVAQAGGIPRIAETQSYVTKVTSTYERWRS